MTLYQDPTSPTGITDDTPEGNSDTARARLRKARAALAMRKEGHDWDLIAETWGYPTPRAAIVACELALEKELKTSEGQEFMRHMVNERYDALLKSVWPKAINDHDPEHLASLEAVRRLMRDYTDLNGLAKPKATIENPTVAQIERWLSTVMKVGQPELPERDFFELEEGPDGTFAPPEDT